MAFKDKIASVVKMGGKERISFVVFIRFRISSYFSTLISSFTPFELRSLRYLCKINTKPSCSLTVYLFYSDIRFVMTEIHWINTNKQQNEKKMFISRVFFVCHRIIVCQQPHTNDKCLYYQSKQYTNTQKKRKNWTKKMGKLDRSRVKWAIERYTK